MGFPLPAADFVERRISLDERFIAHPAATYYMRASESYYRAGILSGALLVIDSSLKPCDGSLMICDTDGEFTIKRYRTHPSPHMENVLTGKREELPGDLIGQALSIFGVITYIINDARSGEFDDCPVM